MVQDLDDAKEILQNEKDEDLREMAKEEVKMVLRSYARWGSQKGSKWSLQKSSPTATPSWHKTPKWRVPAIRFSTNRPQKGLQGGQMKRRGNFAPPFQRSHPDSPLQHLSGKVICRKDQYTFIVTSLPVEVCKPCQLLMYDLLKDRIQPIYKNFANHWDNNIHRTHCHIS